MWSIDRNEQFLKNYYKNTWDCWYCLILISFCGQTVEGINAKTWEHDLKMGWSQNNESLVTLFVQSYLMDLLLNKNGTSRWWMIISDELIRNLMFRLKQNNICFPLVWNIRVLRVLPKMLTINCYKNLFWLFAAIFRHLHDLFSLVFCNDQVNEKVTI